MTDEITNSERYRRERAQQVEDRRAEIIAVAAELFLEKGLEQTTMLDIAARAHISKVTLYRYFPNRDPLAFEIAAQMLQTIVQTASQRVDEGAPIMSTIKEVCLGLIREFSTLQGAYRYIGMFDHLYGDHYPTDELATWYKQHIFGLTVGGISLVANDALDENAKTQVVTLFNMIMSFMEKLAARGELMAEEQEIPLQAQLNAFERIVMIYLKSLEGA